MSIKAPAPRSTLFIFALGLGVRLLGVLFLWLGDGHDQWWRQTLVVLGVVLSIGGIGVLKYLLVKGLRGSTSRPLL